jgi:WD40 repeat protein
MIAAEALSPYKGLRSFEDSEGDVPFFFGREPERAQIEANLMASRLTVVYGETGVGKSSVLRAGVAHHLRGVARENLERHGEPELALVVFDDWRGDPVEALRAAVAEEVTRALGGTLPAPDADAPLADVLRAWQELLGGDVYVVLDQLEEYFLYHQDEDGAGTFAAEFPAAVRAPDLRVNFVAAVREESLAKLDAFKARIPNVLGNYLRLEHLDRDAARSAIVGPIARHAELVGPDEAVEIEPALVEAVLDQVALGRVELGQGGRGAPEDRDESRIETPYLQLVMQRLWDEERAAGSRVLRLATLQRLGGAEQIVGAHVDRALTALTTAEQDLAATMFDHLVTPSGAKIAYGAADLARYARAPEPAVVTVLDRLGHDRIVRTIADGGTHGRYEIFHDVLAEPVLAWKAAHETQRELERQRAEAERRHRRLLRITVAAVLALALMVGVTVFALTQRGEARSQARLASARQFAAEAVSQLGVDPQRSLALAIESVHRKPTSEAEDVLRQALITARERAVLPSRGPVRLASFSPDGSLVLTGSDDGTVRLWRRDGTPVRTLAHGGPVTAARFSPDGRLVLTGSRDGVAAVRRVSTGALVASLHRGAPVTSSDFGRGGSLAVTTSEDGVTRLWRPATGKLVLAVRQRGPVQAAALSPDGRTLLTVGSNPLGEQWRARLFAVPSGRLLRVLPAPGVTTASFSPDGRLLVTGGLDHTAAIWDARSGRRLHLLAEHQEAVTDALFGPGGKLVATTSADGVTRIWDARTGVRLVILVGHANAVNGASFSPDGRFLLTVSSDGTARVWDAATGRPLPVLRGHTDAVGEGTFAPDGSAVVTAGADDTARVWDPGTADELRVLSTASGPVRAAAFSPDDRLVLEAGDDRAARLLTAKGKVVRTLRHPAAVTSAVFSPDGSLVLTADAARTIRAWKANSGALVRAVRGISAGPLAVSPDGRLAAAPAARGGVRILDGATFAPVRQLGSGGPVTAVAFSPDGRLVAAAGEDGKARVWDARTGALIRTFAGHSDALTGVEFDADGSRIVTSSRDHDARIWNVASGASTLLRGHFGPVFGASFSPDGQLVVTAGPATAGLWETGTGKLITYLHGHDQPLTSASFSLDGRRILTASRDGTVRTYACEVCGGLDALVGAAESRLDTLTRPLSASDRRRYVPTGALARTE